MRITVKIGSNVLTRADGSLDVTRLSSLVDQIAELHKQGHELLVVSSGAVACGRSVLAHHSDIKTKDMVDERQLYSAVGQAKLIDRYYELFREHRIAVGQVLTMKENFRTEEHYNTQKNCMEVMLNNGVIPIINENDTVCVTELMFTDNDELSGLVASMMQCNRLILLSNIDGIYTGNPMQAQSLSAPSIPTQTSASTYRPPNPHSAEAACSPSTTQPTKCHSQASKSSLPTASATTSSSTSCNPAATPLAPGL